MPNRPYFDPPHSHPLGLLKSCSLSGPYSWILSQGRHMQRRADNETLIRYQTSLPKRFWVGGWTLHPKAHWAHRLWGRQVASSLSLSLTCICARRLVWRWEPESNQAWYFSSRGAPLSSIFNSVDLIARYVAKWGIARMRLCETSCQEGVSHHFGGVLTLKSKAGYGVSQR